MRRAKRRQPEQDQTATARPIPQWLLPSLVIWIVGIEILAVLKYYAFGSSDWDLGFYSQAMWNLMHGHWEVSIYNVPLLGNHAYWIAFLVAPLYAVFPHPLTLVFLQITSAALAAWPLYRLADETVGGPIATYGTIAYLANPGLLHAVLNEFHFEVLSLGLLGWLLYAWHRRHYRAMSWLGGVLCLVKENLAIIVAMIGFLGLISAPRQRFWWGLSLVGLCWFVAQVVWIIPWLRGTAVHAHFIYYAHLGISLPAVLGSLFTAPHRWWEALATADNARFVALLLAPTAGFAMVGIRWLMPVVPIIVGHLLSNNPGQKAIYMAYGGIPAPFLAAAAMAGIARLSKRFRNLNAASHWLGAVMLGVTLVGQLEWGPLSPSAIGLFPDAIRPQSTFWPDGLDALRWRFVRRIPPQASVIASNLFLAPLAHREQVYALHSLYMDLARVNDPTGFAPPPDLTYTLVDFADPAMRYYLAEDPRRSERLRDWLLGPRWTLVELVESLALFQRVDRVTEDRFVAWRPHVAPHDVRLLAVVNGSVGLSSSSAIPSRLKPGQPIPLRLDWFCLRQPTHQIGVLLVLRSRVRVPLRQYVHRLMYGLRPTTQWQVGELLTERIGVWVPETRVECPCTLEAWFYAYEGEIDLLGYRTPAGSIPPTQPLRLGALEAE